MKARNKLSESRHAASLSTTAVTTLNRTLNASRVQKPGETAQFEELRDFANTLKKPKWLVRFPLVLPTPEARHHASHKSSPLNTRKAARSRADRSSSTPLTPHKEIAKIGSIHALQHLKNQCDVLLHQENKDFRRQRQKLTRLKSQFSLCEKHVALINYSNSRAPYFLLLQKFSAKKHVYE